tara:strand:- start:1570 stop:1902 length:333 start_codon:yes stop_codon:yes gene_type:complete
MIDTDKYEGHTPAPWDAKLTKSCAWRWVSLGLEVPHDECFSEENTVNLALIADAPLLLAEVKRLREALVTVQRSLVWDEKDRAIDGDPITLETLVAQVEQVRSDITEMIE